MGNMMLWKSRTELVVAVSNGTCGLHRVRVSTLPHSLRWPEAQETALKQTCTHLNCCFDLRHCNVGTGESDSLFPDRLINWLLEDSEPHLLCFCLISGWSVGLAWCGVRSLPLGRLTSVWLQLHPSDQCSASTQI